MRTTDIWEKMILNILRMFADLTKQMPGFERLSPKFEKSIKTMYPKMLELIKADKDNCFVTLCHGDLWSNNIMFTKDCNEHPTDAILCDYQVSFIGPAVLDLANTLYSSSHVTLRDHDYDRLVQLYHQALSSALSKLKYPKAIPTLTDIQVQLLRHGIVNATMALFALTLRSYDKLAEMDLSIIMGDKESDKEFRNNMAMNVKDNEGLQFLLNYFDRRGYFD